MRILFLSQGLPFPVYLDGLTIRVYHLLKEFSRWAECHLIAFGNYELTNKETELLKTIATFDIVNYANYGGIRGLFGKIFSTRRYYSKEFENKVGEAIRCFRPDIVFCEQTYMAQYVELFGDLPKVMSAVDAISLAALKQAKINSSLVNNLSMRYVARQRLSIEKKYFPKFDRVTVVGQHDADFLLKYIKTDVAVIPNGVDIDYFNPARLNANRNTILFSGNLSAPMNEEACVYLLQNVFPYIHSRFPDIKLVIAGRNPTSKIQENMRHYVMLLKDVADMRDVMADALLYVSPIAYGTGIKNNVLQAMAMGIPTLVTPLISKPIGIVCEKTGFVADRGPEFLQAIEMVLTDKAMLESVGKAGRSHIENNYSWQYVTLAYYKMFYELIHKKSGMRLKKC